MIKKAFIFLLLNLFANGVQANCTAANAMKGHWTFQLRGSTVLDGPDDYLVATDVNHKQMSLVGNLIFNAKSELIRGAAIDSIDAIGFGAFTPNFDKEEYQGFIVDKKLKRGTVRFNKWKKDANSCSTTALVGFRGKDKVNGQVYAKVYCVLSNFLGKTKHTATLDGTCFRERLVGGIDTVDMIFVSGFMQKRTNVKY